MRVNISISVEMKGNQKKKIPVLEVLSDPSVNLVCGCIFVVSGIGIVLAFIMRVYNWLLISCFFL